MGVSLKKIGHFHPHGLASSFEDCIREVGSPHCHLKTMDKIRDKSVWMKMT